MKSVIAASGASLALALTACVGNASHSAANLEEAEDYRISVEIPLDAMHFKDGDIVKVDELLSERTSFDPDEFQLDEVVLIARADGPDSHAELLVLEWRSGQVAVPAGGAEDWFEVRIPAPDEDLGGAWLLDVDGAVTVDTLVAVVEPSPRTLPVAKTAYRTTTVYRDRYREPRRSMFWVYDPNRYFVYHYHGAWPYRYFVGPWSYRYYDLAYRPHWYGYGPHYRPRHGRHERRRWREGDYDWRQRRGRGGTGSLDRLDERRSETAVPRRLDPELAKLRRNHPRLRQFHRDDRVPRRPGRGHEIPRQPKHATATRTHPSPLTMRRERDGNRVFERRSAAAERRSGATRRTISPGGNVVSRELPRLERRSAVPPRPDVRARRDISLPGRPRAASRPPREVERVFSPPRRVRMQRAATPEQRRSVDVRRRGFERAAERRAAPDRSESRAVRPPERRSAPVPTSRPRAFERAVQPEAPRAAPARHQPPARKSASGSRRDMRVVERR